MIDEFVVGFLSVFKLILGVIQSPETYKVLGMSIGIIVSLVSLYILIIIIALLLDIVEQKIKQRRMK